ncbi:non-LTR retroelement reverse transcriptase-like [Senna tora]|uniref:Non-LTR retroelement reverse transcriptase-like n=1 Tax=Senna tora TaxID=362788 RepID=A0A834WDL1_9FABA|nr:non-LTR retroelement reverse transcriptase-like [Senna tora]
MQRPNRDGEDDSFFWLPSSAYLNSAFPDNTSSDLLWKKYGDNQRMRRCFTDSDICKRCGQAAETNLHTIRDCPYVSGLWRSMVKNRFSNKFFNSNLQEWILLNLSNDLSQEGDSRWNSIFGIECWLIWKQRNHWIFNVEVPHLRLVLMIGINLTKDGLRLMLMGLSGKTLNTWRVGRLARNENGNWLFEFAKHLGKGCVDHAEIWSIFFGIITGWEKGFKHVIVESDNRNVINLICNRYDGAHPLRNILSRIRELLNRDWHMKIKHVFREGNMVADCLARHAHSIPPGLLMFNSPPSFCNSLLWKDSCSSPH